jgi:RNA polymerase sigma factor (sigma-70 family)
MNTLFDDIGLKSNSTDQEKNKLIAAAISSLSCKEQEALELYYEKNMKMKDIAVIMKCSVSTASNHRKRALFKLRRQVCPESFEHIYKILYSALDK